MTVRVHAGDATPWDGLAEVWIGDAAGPPEGRVYRVGASRAYRDRLVLKLVGVEDGDAAAKLRGLTVLAPDALAPSLPGGRWWSARLVGAAVVSEDGSALGKVDDVWPTGGVDLLVVNRDAEDELLIPMAEEIVLNVDEKAREIRVRLPDGLADLNRSRDGGA